MNTRNTPYIDELTAYQWAALAADSMRALTQKSRQALIKFLFQAILEDGKRLLPGGTVVYLASERKLHTLLAVQHLAAKLLEAVQKIRGSWEPGAWNLTTPSVTWPVHIAEGAVS